MPPASLPRAISCASRVLPKAIYNQRQAETAFYERFFRGVRHWAVVSQTLLNSARAVATDHGLAAMDALHVAAAGALGVAQFVTSEKKEKPLFRVASLPILSLHG